MRNRSREWNGGMPGERRIAGSRWKRILLVVVLVIVIVAAVLVASWRVLDDGQKLALFSAGACGADTGIAGRGDR